MVSLGSGETVAGQIDCLATVLQAAFGEDDSTAPQWAGDRQPEGEGQGSTGLRQLGQVGDVLDLDRVVVDAGGQARLILAGDLMAVPASSMVTVKLGFA